MRTFCLFLSLLIWLPMEAQVNYDESKIPSYSLPELLTAEDGSSIGTTDEWQNKRRNEIFQLIESHMFGKVPAEKVKVKFEENSLNENALGGKATSKEVSIIFRSGKQQVAVSMLIYLPKGLIGPMPVFLGTNFYGNHTIIDDKDISLPTSWIRNNEDFGISNNRASEASRGVRSSRWPVEMIIERGYGLANIYYGDIDPDFDDEFQNGIHPLFNAEGQKKPANDEWGSIAAWAFTLTKAMDYFEKDKAIDAERVAVIGHSRLGKTALWAGAMDERFGLVISNNSGCGGAALSRRKFGETLEAINTRFPHWFCKNFHVYNAKEEDQPFDQHMLLSLIAPRPLYVASAEGDRWADPRGEYVSLYHASEVYQLFDAESSLPKASPAVDMPRIHGYLGYHIRSGKHDLTRYDWEQYLNFADGFFR